MLLVILVVLAIRSITYGSYVKKDDNLTSTAFSVMISDTLVAVLAGLVIFPAAFTFGVKRH
ncbi:MAG: hypothetical protein IKM74_03035 [Bacteroidales bacterium]|nr:hypothetical protein [Bacteroidales bacterium]